MDLMKQIALDNDITVSALVKQWLENYKKTEGEEQNEKE